MKAFLRNPTAMRQLGVLIGLQILVCAAALALAGTSAGLAVGVSALVSCGVFYLFSVARHREAMCLAAEIDEVLHTGRRLNFSDCQEGDVAIVRNEVSKMTARLCRTADQLEHEKRALSDALADISHQIRTPLTAIELMVPVIERTADGEERTRKLHELERMVDRVSWLVTSLLKMARFDANATALQKRTVDATVVAQAALEPLAIALDIRGIDCVVEVDGAPVFEGDQVWTTEAIENIIKNCMEHTPAQGKIFIRIEEDAVATRMSIADTGPGIAEADLPHVFERFYRGAVSGGSCVRQDSLGKRHAIAPLGASSDNRSGAPETPLPRQPQGFGIGLSLAQSYISAQGGTLRAGNVPTGGACFEIAFPKVMV